MLREVLDAVGTGVFSPHETNRFSGLVDMLRQNDHFLVTADFDSYSASQRLVADRWREPAQWWRSSVLNTAGMGWFSSDRTIGEYAREIWNIPVNPGK